MTLGELKAYLDGFKRLKGTEVIWMPGSNIPHPPENLESPDDVKIGETEHGTWFDIDGLVFDGSNRLVPVYQKRK